MIERRLSLLPQGPSQEQEAPDRPVPHDPHTQMLGSGIARTMDDAFAGVQTITTMTRGAWINSRIRVHHSANVRLARLTWNEPVNSWRPSDAVHYPFQPIRIG